MSDAVQKPFPRSSHTTGPTGRASAAGINASNAATAPKMMAVLRVNREGPAGSLFEGAVWRSSSDYSDLVVTCREIDLDRSIRAGRVGLLLAVHRYEHRAAPTTV